jgi:hypothetical protein
MEINRFKKKGESDLNAGCCPPSLRWCEEVRANWASRVTFGMSVKSMIRNQDSTTETEKWRLID